MVAVLAYLSVISAVFAALSGWAFAIYARTSPRDVNMLGWSSVATVLFTGVTLFLLRAMQST